MTPKVVLLMYVCFLAVWTVCDFLWAVLPHDNEFRFTAMQNIVKPSIAFAVYMGLRYYWNKKKAPKSTRHLK